MTDNNTRSQDTRRKVYQPVVETKIPQDVQDAFRGEGYELRLIRWSITGKEDYRNLHRRVQEGYEFVTAKELKDLAPHFASTLKSQSTSIAKGILTIGDNCLMKVDIDLRDSRREYFKKKTHQEVQAVDINVLGKKHGLIDGGSKSQVITREPTQFDE